MSSSIQSYEADDEDIDIKSYIINSQVRAMNAAMDKELVAKKRNPTDKFWMLFVEGQSSPTHKHEDYMTAMLEAKRLMDQSNFKGSRIYVLEATGMVEARVTKEFVHTEITYEQEKQNQI